MKEIKNVYAIVYSSHETKKSRIFYVLASDFTTALIKHRQEDMDSINFFTEDFVIRSINLHCEDVNY
jgi:hypothetical protein